MYIVKYLFKIKLMSHLMLNFGDMNVWGNVFGDKGFTPVQNKVNGKYFEYYCVGSEEKKITYFCS